MDEFTDQQLRAIVDSLRLDALGIDVETAEIQLVRWAHQAYIAGGLLNLLLDQKVAVVGFEGPEPVFSALDATAVERPTREIWLPEPEERLDDRN